MACSAPTRAPKGLVDGKARLDGNPLAPTTLIGMSPVKAEDAARGPKTRGPRRHCPGPCVVPPLGSGTGPGPRGPETPPRAEAWVTGVHDSGSYGAVLDEALRKLGCSGWRARQAQYRKQRPYLGIGIATCQERNVFRATEFWMRADEPGFARTPSPAGVSVKIDACRSRRNNPQTVATGPR